MGPDGADRQMADLLKQAVDSGQLRDLDRHVALFLERLAGGDQPWLLLAAALASRAVGEGHVCLPLETVAGRPVFGVAPGGEDPPPLLAPDLDSWRRSLLQSGVVSGDPSTPLVLDRRDRLYLGRYFRYEQAVARRLLAKSCSLEEVDTAWGASLLSRLFGPVADGVDWQRAAAALALVKRLVVISGGPGTGKTHTVARLLALLQGMHGGGLRIGLAAPTGKAAARLQESIGKVLQSAAIRDFLADLDIDVPDRAMTLHRLLGVVPGSGRFRHDSSRPLALDVLVIDEASMIDLELMAGVLDALPDQARLVLLGDRDQLASVEAGSLFGDLCSRADAGWSGGLCQVMGRLTGMALEPGDPSPPAFNDAVVMLRKSYRFHDDSGIGRLARAVNRGDGRELEEIMASGGTELTLVSATGPGQREWLAREIVARFRPLFTARDGGEALAALDRFRILCVLRQGVFGVAGVNSLVEQVLRRQGLIPPETRWYRGRPVMILANHYGLKLYNGDIGVLWPDGQGQLMAWFLRPDKTLRPVAPARLPRHETAWAITVHKAQGSEFEHVLLLLPGQDGGRDGGYLPLLTRELLYTGITRASGRLTICSSVQTLHAAVQRRVVRFSGLADLLANDSACNLNQ